MAIINISAASLARFKAFKRDYNQYNGLVEGLIERDYHLIKKVVDLTEKERTMYKELAEKCNYQPENGATDLGCSFYLTLQPIYNAIIR
jgi:hypothetical protein